VRVVEVDVARKRIALTMRSGEIAASPRDSKPTTRPEAPRGRSPEPKGARDTGGGMGALGAKLSEALKGR
jgi:uncharacterized protein